MIIRQDGWEFTRQLGIGEREHVRTSLLGIGFFEYKHIIGQLTGAIRAADTLGMMLRAHVNFDRLGRDDQERVFALFRLNSSHQIEPWSGLDRAKFDGICKKLEIMIVEDVYASFDDVARTVQLGILGIWAKSGGRFLGGNHAMHGDDVLRATHSQFYHDTDRFWSGWNG